MIRQVAVTDTEAIQFTTVTPTFPEPMEPIPTSHILEEPATELLTQVAESICESRRWKPALFRFRLTAVAAGSPEQSPGSSPDFPLERATNPKEPNHEC
jgi:hypothetical protein